MAAPFELRPMSLGELLDRAFTIYRRHFGIFLGIMLIATLVPGLLLVTYAALLRSQPMTAVVFALLYVPLGMIGYLAATGATTRAVSASLLGEPVGVASSFESVRGRLGSLFGASLIMGIGVLIGLILLIVPGVIALLRWFVMVPTLLLEGIGPEASLRRSWHLTEGAMGRIFLVFLLTMAVSFAISMLLVMPLTVGALLAARTGHLPVWTEVATQALQYLANVVVLPVQSILTVLIYYDLRIRKEGFDVERMMASLGVAPTPPSPPVPPALG